IKAITFEGYAADHAGITVAMRHLDGPVLWYPAVLSGYTEVRLRQVDLCRAAGQAFSGRVYWVDLAFNRPSDVDNRWAPAIRAWQDALTIEFSPPPAPAPRVYKLYFWPSGDKPYWQYTEAATAVKLLAPSDIAMPYPHSINWVAGSRAIVDALLAAGYPRRGEQRFPALERLLKEENR
ncbi:MAG: hypothetical protein ABII82_06000, partial [Verrucomicrobiota bacterium]